MSIDNVQDITPRKQYVASGGQTVFPYDFPIFDDGDLVVDVDGVILTITTDYTVSGAGNDNGGNVTLTSGATAGEIVTIYRDIPIERDTDFQQNGPWRSASINDELDRMTLIDQQLELATTRALRVPVNDAADFADLEIPAASSRASKFLAFDANGNPTVSNGTGADTGLREDIASGAAGAVTFVDTVADMKALTGLVDGAVVVTKEYATGKGGGGTYLYYATPPSTAESFVYHDQTTGGGQFELLDAKKNILQAGADPTGASDSSAAFDRADIGENIYVPAGTYDFTSAVTCTVDGTLFYGDGGYASTITKSFNGIPLTFDGDSSGIVGIGIEGDGANFTGGGVKLKGYNSVVKMCRINDTADSCVLFDAAVGTNVGSGTYAVVEDCFLLPTNTSTTYSIRSIGTDDSTRPTVRTFRNISGGGPGPDFSGMNRAILADSFCTIIKFDANSSKIDIHNNRFTNAAANLTVYGSDHTIDNNIWGFGATYGITIDSTCANVHWGPNNPIVVGTSTLQSPTIGATIGGPQANNIHTDLIDYKNQFEWKGTTTDGTFGNSTYSAYYKLSGRHCYASFSLLRGSTATNATGTWQFRLPFEAFVTATGVALVKSSTGTYNPAVFEVQGGSSLAVLYLPASTAAMTDASIAFGTGGLIEATMNYLISPT